MSRETWEDWQAYVALEMPFEDVRENIRHADLTALLRNIHRDSKQHPSPYTVQECVLRFGDDLPPAPTRHLDWRVSKANFLKAVGADAPPTQTRRRTPAPSPDRPPPPMARPRPARRRR